MARSWKSGVGTTRSGRGIFWSRWRGTTGLALISAGSLAAASLALVTVPAQAKQVDMGTAPLVVTGDYGSPGLTENFNPFGAGHLEGVDYIYEPMYVVTSLNGRKTPWLATKYRWVNAKELTFTIRSGVKFSNGTPFTAQDVVYTFNLLKKYPALDTNAVWATLASVTARGNQVIFKFKTRDIPEWYYIATTPIVDAAQFSKVKNPVTFTNPDPIGTGPFILDSFTPSEYTLKYNPKYWQRNKVHVPLIEMVALTTNTITDEGLASGKFDWGDVFVPNQQKTFIAKDPAHRFSWQPYANPWVLYVNLTKWPFNQLKFREALAYAINRHEIVTRGEYGYMKPAYQSLIPPAMQARGWISPSLAAHYNYHFNLAKAARLLKEMGLKKNAAGKLLGKNGKPLTFTLEVPAGWTDIIQDSSFMAKDFEKLGLTINLVTPSPSTVGNNMDTGEFQMADYYSSGAIADPYTIYHDMLSSSETAPIGKIAPSNWERWNNATTNKLLAEWQQTVSIKRQKQIAVQLQKIMLSQLPVITIDYGVFWNQYTTVHYVGWPNAKNPYAAPSATDWPDDLLIMTHLKPAK